MIRVDARPTTFLKKYIWGHFLLLVGAFYFFYEKGLFFMWRVIFLWGRFFWVMPPPPHPRLTENCVGTHAPTPWAHEEVFGGSGQSQKAQKKQHKDKKLGHPPPPHREKVAKRAPHGEKRGKLKAPTWRKSNRKSPHIVGKLFFIFRGGVSLLLHPLPPTPLRASMPQSPSNIYSGI